MPDGLTREPRQPILLTTDAVGGVWRYTIDLGRELVARGIAVRIVTLGPPPPPALRADAAGLPLAVTGLPLGWTATDPGELADTAAALRDLAASAAAIHLHDPALAGRRPWPVPLVSVCHSCTATWWRAVRGGPLPDEFRWRADATAAGLDLSDAIIAPTHAHAQAVRDTYGPRPITVVHNGSDFSPAAACRERAVLAAGRLWDEGKGIATLDRAAPYLEAPIRAAGPLAGPNGATAAFANLDLLGALGPDEMRAAYASASVFASPASYEPFGLSVLEAARSATRLVLSDIPSFRELWDGAATFVAADSDWPAALRAALDAPDDGAARARAARYTIAAMADGVLAVHRRLGARV